MSIDAMLEEKWVIIFLSNGGMQSLEFTSEELCREFYKGLMVNVSNPDLVMTSWLGRVA